MSARYPRIRVRAHPPLVMGGESGCRALAGPVALRCLPALRRIAHHQLHRAALAVHRLPADQCQQALHQQLAGLLGVLLHGGQRRRHRSRQRNVVEAGDRHVLRHPQPGLAQGPHRTDGDQVAGRADRVDRFAARQQRLAGLLAGSLGGDGIVLQRWLGAQAALLQRRHMAAGALLEFGVMAGGMAEEGDPAAALLQQVGGDVVPALEVVAADRHAGLAGQGGAPAHEVRTLPAG
ncbi:hypothetical protein G6F54_013263 [Rhizopus delemar]|nr:hypothetical protein G6F54_013263 [Rhizopus delemar]